MTRRGVVLHALALVLWLLACPARADTPGDEVTVEVLDVDMDRERVSLSLKATQEDPWQHFARTHAIGQVVPGKVTKLASFGAFVGLQHDIDVVTGKRPLTALEQRVLGEVRERFFAGAAALADGSWEGREVAEYWVKVGKLDRTQWTRSRARFPEAIAQPDGQHSHKA